MERNTIALGTVLGIALLVVGAGAVTALGPGETATQEEPTTNTSDAIERTIHVSATGDAKAQPDQAVVRVAIIAEADDVGAVRNELATGSEELTTALDELGVEYETTSYDISERYQPRETRPRPRYEGQHSYEITATDPARAGELVDAAAGAGAEINSVSLTLSEQRRSELREAAVEAAMSDASQQAETIAGEGGLTVVAPISVDATQRQYRPVTFDAAQTKSGDGSAPPTEIATGAVSVTYNVDVTYEATQD
jgi:uncharacterized protein YggE